MTTFIETGTSTGWMIEAMKRHFNDIYSIEFDDTLYKEADKKFMNDANVHIYHGDSAVQIHAILAQVTNPSLFWLDAHGTGNITFQNAPIEAELKAIFAHSVKGHIIVIDDARHFSLRDIRRIRRIAYRNNHSFLIEEGLFRLAPR